MRTRGQLSHCRTRGPLYGMCAALQPRGGWYPSLARRRQYEATRERNYLNIACGQVQPPCFSVLLYSLSFRCDFLHADYDVSHHACPLESVFICSGRRKKMRRLRAERLALALTMGTRSQHPPGRAASHEVCAGLCSDDADRPVYHAACKY